MCPERVVTTCLQLLPCFGPSRLALSLAPYPLQWTHAPTNRAPRARTAAPCSTTPVPWFLTSSSAVGYDARVSMGEHRWEHCVFTALVTAVCRHGLCLTPSPVHTRTHTSMHLAVDPCKDPATCKEGYCCKTRMTDSGTFVPVCVPTCTENSCPAGKNCVAITSPTSGACRSTCGECSTYSQLDHTCSCNSLSIALYTLRTPEHCPARLLPCAL